MPNIQLLELEITSLCNLACSFCYLGEHLGKGEMSSKQAYRLLEEAHEIGVDKIVFTGGEPLLHPHLEELIKRANDLGWHPGVLSNGVLLSDSILETLLGRISFLQLSLHDLPEDDDLARLTCDRVRRLKAFGIPVTLLITLTAANLSKLEGFLRLIDELNTPTGFQRFCPVSGENLEHLALDMDEYMKALTVLWQRMQEVDLLACEDPLMNLNMPNELLSALPPEIHLGCSAGRWAAVVAYDGALQPCAKLRCSDMNVFEVGLRTALENSPLLESLRRPADDSACDSCQYNVVCRGCRADAYNSGLPLWGKDSLCQRAVN